MNGQQVDQRESASAFDLLEHPGFADVLKDVTREAKAARKVIFGQADSEQYAHARGSLAVLHSVVCAIFRRANKEPPPYVAALFE